MKRIVRGVCGLLSAVMQLSTTAMAADYTQVVTSDERVKGFYNVYNGENASLQMELAGRYNSGAMNADGGSLEIVQFNARNGFAYAVSGVKGVLIAIDLNENTSGSTVADLTATGKEYDLEDIVKAEDFTYGDMTSVAVSPDGKTLAVYELTGEQDETPDIPSVPGIDPILAAILTAANQQRFEDVVSDAYCYDAVNWAVERNITSGTGKYTFSPDSNCTRADFVTFLWRAAGKPVVNFAMNVSDVKEDAYYAEAVRWAASLGIVTGLSKNTFGAANAVTCEQAVTMLWRFAKQQGFDTTQGGMAIREFDDYDSLSEYAREAMAWAVNAGILKGSGNRLMPDADCTRAQLVTLLYRLESQTR